MQALRVHIKAEPAQSCRLLGPGVLDVHPPPDGPGTGTGERCLGGQGVVGVVGRSRFLVCSLHAHYDPHNDWTREPGRMRSGVRSPRGEAKIRHTRLRVLLQYMCDDLSGIESIRNLELSDRTVECSMDGSSNNF